MTLFESLKQIAAEHGKKVYPEILGYYYYREPIPEDLKNYDMVFITSDIPKPLPVKIVQFHTSAERKYPGTYSWLPTDNWDQIYPQLPPSEPTEIPTVGFVGRCPVINGQIHRGFEERYEALRALLKSSEVCADFHIRTGTEGSACGFYPQLPDDLRKKDGPLFKTNMPANQYQLCARGNANWSIRFYETLAYGRIPIYIESGGHLAFDAFYDYFGYLPQWNNTYNKCPFVYVDNLDNLEETLISFHESRDIEEMQIQCYCLFWNYFSVVQQARHFEEHINDFKPWSPP